VGICAIIGHGKTHGSIPPKGDRVGMPNVKDVFVVVEVRENPRLVKLHLVKGGTLIRDISWEMLTFLDQEDASHAAARIVREATEDRTFMHFPQVSVVQLRPSLQVKSKIICIGSFAA
jgi:hypothetical protein